MVAMETSSRPSGSAAQKLATRKPILIPLKYRKRSIWIILLYICILLIPWVATYGMMIRPLNSGSYIHQRFGITWVEYLNISIRIKVLGVFERIQAVLAIPIISGLLAQAAVVYSQRRRPGQKLSVGQLLALADRPWSDIALWFRCLRNEVGSPLITLGGLFIILVAATPALKGLLVQYDLQYIVPCWEYVLPFYCSVSLTTSGKPRTQAAHPLLS